MTDTNFDPMAAAKMIMKDRENAIKALAKVAADIDTTEVKLADLHDDERTAYDSALNVGWTQAELKQIGFTRRTSNKRNVRKRNPEHTTGDQTEHSNETNPASDDQDLSA